MYSGKDKRHKYLVFDTGTGPLRQLYNLKVGDYKRFDTKSSKV